MQRFYFIVDFSKNKCHIYDEINKIFPKLFIKD